MKKRIKMFVWVRGKSTYAKENIRMDGLVQQVDSATQHWQRLRSGDFNKIEHRVSKIGRKYFHCFLSRQENIYSINRSFQTVSFRVISICHSPSSDHQNHARKSVSKEINEEQRNCPGKTKAPCFDWLWSSRNQHHSDDELKVPSVEGRLGLQAIFIGVKNYGQHYEQ